MKKAGGCLFPEVDIPGVANMLPETLGRPSRSLFSSSKWPGCSPGWGDSVKDYGVCAVNPGLGWSSSFPSSSVCSEVTGLG